jgi:hypothetical protein
MSQSKLVAAFGSFTKDQLVALRDAGFAVLTTDSPAEADTRALARKAKLPVVERKAAWSLLDHPTSQVRTDVDKRTGEVRDYNANGGFTRDWLLVEEAHCVVVGSGVGTRRMENIQAAAEAHKRTVRVVEPPKPVAPPVDLEAVNAELAALSF